MPQQLEVEIETHDRMLEFEMFEATSGLSAESSRVTFSDGSTVAYGGTMVRKAVGFPAIVHVAVELATAVGTGLVTNWLYDKLKSKPAKLRINRREVEITPEKIRIVIEEIEREG
jgi:hypothetical protein